MLLCFDRPDASMLPVLPTMANSSLQARVSPGEYYKVKLRTASGTSLTIRYRKRPAMQDCCSVESSNGGAESSTTRHGRGGTACANIDVDQTFDKLTDLREYEGYDCDSVSLDCLEVLSESVQPDFSAYHFWAAEECTNSDGSDVGSNDAVAEFPGSLNVPTTPGTNGCLADSIIGEDRRCALFEELCTGGMQTQNSTLMHSLEESVRLEQVNTINEDFAPASKLGDREEQQEIPPYVSRLSPQDQAEIENSELQLIDIPSQLQIESSGAVLYCPLSQMERWDDIERGEHGKGLPKKGFPCDDTKYNDELWSVLRKPEEGNETRAASESPSTAIVGNVSSKLGVSIQDNRSRSSFGCLAAGSKKIRKKRIKRATPLLTMRSWLTETFIPEQEPGPREYENEECILSPKQPLDDHDQNLEVKEIANSSSQAPFETKYLLEAADVSIGQLHSNTPEGQNPRSMHTALSSKTSRGESQESDYCNLLEMHWNLNGGHASSTVPSHRSISKNFDRLQYYTNPFMELPRPQPRAKSYLVPDHTRKKQLPERAVTILRKWLDDHIGFPFANREEKYELVSATGLTLPQVENWLSNSRHKLKLKRSYYEGRELRMDIKSIKSGRGRKKKYRCQS